MNALLVTMWVCCLIGLTFADSAWRGNNSNTYCRR